MLTKRLYMLAGALRVICGILISNTMGFTADHNVVVDRIYRSQTIHVAQVKHSSKNLRKISSSFLRLYFQQDSMIYSGSHFLL